MKLVNNMDQIKIAMVAYLNAKPFKLGLLELKDSIELLEETPAVCADLFFNNQVDIALLPVGALKGKEDVILFSDFCIGSIGDVQTVCLFSDTLIENIETVYLDSHSRTSVLLTKLMLAESGYKNIEFINANTENVILKKGEAKLMIGDKVFRNKTSFKWKIDLSTWWQEKTGLPFVFAVWVRSKHLISTDLKKVENALSNGINRIDEVVSLIETDVDLKHYFNENISYSFDDNKRKAVKLFYEMLDEFGIQ